MKTRTIALILLAALSLTIGPVVPAGAQECVANPPLQTKCGDCPNPTGTCPDVNIVNVSPIGDDGKFTVTVNYRKAALMSWTGSGGALRCGSPTDETAPCVNSEATYTKTIELSARCWSPGQYQFRIAIQNCMLPWTNWSDTACTTYTVPETTCGAPVPPCDPHDTTSSCYCPDEQDPQCEIQDKPCKGERCQGSPCYVASGIYETSALDLQLPTNGFPLTLGRIYNSSHAIDGPLGRGWTSSLDARVYYVTARLGTPNTSPTASWNQAIVVLPDGTHRTFTAPNPELPTNTMITFTPPTGRNDTLTRNADGSWDLEIQHSLSVYHFDTTGRLETMTDDFGNRLRRTYDGAGRIQRVADESGSGRYLDVYWGPNGRIADVTDNSGRVVHYDYDGDGMLTRAVDPENHGTSYEYADGRFAPALAEIRDQWGRVLTSLTWEQNSFEKPTGRLKSYTEEGETYTYTYGDGLTSAGRWTKKTDSAGLSWTYPYRADDLITERRGPDGTSGATYDESGRLTASTDLAGIRTQYGWTAAGVLTSVTQASGTADQIRYDYGYDANFPWKVNSVVPKDPDTGAVDRDWQETRYEYYPPGAAAPGSLHTVLRVKTDGSSEVVTTYEYDAKGRVTRVLDALGNATDYTYDAAGNLATVTRPANDDLGTRPSVTYGYDALGRVTTITEGQAVTLVTYDKVDRVTQTKVQKNGSCGGGEVCEFVTGVLYDQYEAGYARLWVHQTDANGIVTKQAYDTYGRLVVSRDAQSNDTRYNYVKKHLVGITDANDYTTGYLYDSAGRLWKTIFPDAAEESYTYSADGLLATKTDRKGNVISYTYDAHKRLSQKVYNNGTDGTIHFVYEGQKLVRVENRSQGVNEDHVYTYDAGYRTASEQQGPRGTVRWEYDTRDQVSRMSVDGGPTTDYTYYPDGSMNTITWSLVSGQFKYHYTPDGQYATVSFPNGQSRNYSYDWAGRLLQLANLHPTTGNLATYSYGYDVDWATGLKTRKGQRTSMTADVPAQSLSGALTKYYYDVHYQLTGADYPSAAPFNGEVARWAYDAIGNRTSETVNGVTANYTYQKLGANPKNWQRLLSAGPISFTYFADGALASRTAVGGEYAYNYDFDGGYRSVSGSLTKNYVDDYRHRNTGESGAQASIGIIWDKANLIAVDSPILNLLRGQGLDDTLATADSEVKFLAVDGTSSAVVAVSAGGGVQSLTLYDAWGNARGSASSSWTGFSGSRDRSEALVDMRFRQYLPEVGRFAREDPLGDIDGPSLYAYVQNDPVLFADPLGLYKLQDNIKRKPHGQPERLCGSPFACSVVMADVLCDCHCDRGFIVADVTLRLFGTINYFDGPFGAKQRSTVDKTVVDAKSAIRHEYLWHINKAIVGIEPLVKSLGSKYFASVESCDLECKTISKLITGEFWKILKQTQEAENHKK